MTRQPSRHMVTLLDFSKVEAELLAHLILYGENMENCRIRRTGKHGLVEKDGKHFLIDSEGVGSAEPLEDVKDYVDWYKFKFNEAGEILSFDINPCVRFHFNLDRLVEDGIITDQKVPLDVFIRTFGARTESNFEYCQAFLDGKAIFA